MPCSESWDNMFGDLSHCSEDELLTFVGLILSRTERELSSFSKNELAEITQEIERRKGEFAQAFTALA
jgi:hypothetical protein